MTMWSPLLRHARNNVVMAAIPLAKSCAFSAPSRAASLLSTEVTVGLPMRPYSGCWRSEWPSTRSTRSLVDWKVKGAECTIGVVIELDASHAPEPARTHSVDPSLRSIILFYSADVALFGAISRSAIRSPISVVSPITRATPRFMKNLLPILGPGWIAKPVRRQHM